MQGISFLVMGEQKKPNKRLPRCAVGGNHHCAPASAGGMKTVAVMASGDTQKLESQCPSSSGARTLKERQLLPEIRVEAERPGKTLWLLSDSAHHHLPVPPIG
jgi:hypothetical protein